MVTQTTSWASLQKETVSMGQSEDCRVLSLWTLYMALPQVPNLYSAPWSTVVAPA